MTVLAIFVNEINQMQKMLTDSFIQRNMLNEFRDNFRFNCGPSLGVYICSACKKNFV